MKKSHTALDGLFRYAESLKFGEVHIRFDQKTGLRAIIAIHSLKRGPAIGGCRCVPYISADAAFEDAIRLACMMSYKAAISQLNHGGAKAVLMRPAVIKDRKAWFEAFGDFVHELGGRYITAVDSGTLLSDMDIINERTPWVTCTTRENVPNDPSPLTALGVRRGIEAAARFALQKDLSGLHVSIQGAGHVGYFLAQELVAHGARISICDINPALVERSVSELGAKAVSPDDIYDVQSDVFAPCALGAVLNRDSIERLKAAKVRIIAGSANNQLAHQRYAELMHEHGILYAPDFVINSGGLIYSAAVYDHADVPRAKNQVENIYQTLTDIFQKSAEDNLNTHEVAMRLARERLMETSGSAFCNQT